MLIPTQKDTIRSVISACLVPTFLAIVLNGCAAAPAKDFPTPTGDPKLKSEAGLKRLNNLVFELLNAATPGTARQTFTNPRRGWVYIRVPKPMSAAQRQPVALLDGREVSLKAVDDGLETMRYLGQGAHTVAVSPAPQRLEVRAIGELVYAAYGDNPHVPEMGKYTWQYLRQHCLDNYNTMIGSSATDANGKSPQEAEIKEWTDQGKRWFTIEPVPDDYRVAKAAKTADEAFNYWTKTTGMTHPLMSGIFADEFGGKYQTKYYAGWTEALRRIKADAKFSNREFYAYSPSRFLPLNELQETFPFFKSIVDLDYGLAPEWYMVEGRSRPGRIINKTEDLLAEFSPGWEAASRDSFEAITPGASRDRLVVLSVLSERGHENSDLFADYDFNVFLDAQFQFVATDPSFAGIRGLQQYLSSYCGEEQLRLFAKLVRHYAIEGKTDLMLKDPYVLTHLQNPDFVEGVKGWTLTPAITGAGDVSIAAKNVPGLGTLEGYYQAPAKWGDDAVWTKRSGAKPNLISQEIRDLVPGRLYSLRFMTGDYQEFLQGKSELKKHQVSAKIENADAIADKCFQAVVGTGYWYGFGAFKRDNLYCMNYHQQVFRAKGTTARLILSDWGSPTAAGGPEGQEFLWNSMQIQPYFE